MLNQGDKHQLLTDLKMNSSKRATIIHSRLHASKTVQLEVKIELKLLFIAHPCYCQIYGMSMQRLLLIACSHH